ncbi:Hypothetical predicted protein [Cloeon dipterum]|uniref:Regulator of telomere elongation helicase 1 homolog n=1 Tax=Cloeon dipterum TaxID=197152 RepID=A0A8S1BWT2_9INSE|nr:Hypothetical predicted protein [Cloeon dipterum]
MPEIEINGVVVDFPFDPYDVQKVYMEKVIECLHKGVNGVLESPTGTGKTLSLLCASLGWLKVKKSQMQAQAAQRSAAGGPNSVTNVMQSLGFSSKSAVPQELMGINYPKIIYASRTHTQLSQALNELRRTKYAKGFKSTIIGSRDQLCIHSEFVTAHSCVFHNRFEEMKNGPLITETSGIVDIEDLVRKGTTHKCCPYYMARELKDNADVVFMPYNYLLDPLAKKAQNIQLDNSVIILDEAHNVEKICEEAGSLQFRSTDVALCISEITKVMKDLVNHMESNGFGVETSASVRDFNQDDLVLLKTMFLRLEDEIDEIEVSGDGTTYPGQKIFDILGKADISSNSLEHLHPVVDKLVQYLSTSSISPVQRMGAGLQKFSELLTVVFTNRGDRDDPNQSYYKLYVTFEEAKSTKKTWLDTKSDKFKKGRVLNYWCFSPSFGMKMLWQQGELGINIPVTLENGHVVTGDQVFVGVVSTGPDGTSLNSSYNTRNDPKYISALGRTIVNFSRVIPGGLLVFFPSYPLMKKCQDEWQGLGIWSKIVENKSIFVESQIRDAFASNMAEYYEKIHGPDGKGACFLAVCRGKVSEGLDFSDNNGRAVIITGLPYPPFKDPRVVLKQQYLDTVRNRDKTGISGQMWYQLEASRAVNQAIGRVIRHKSDFGAILLCDTRFGNAGFKQQLSTWLQPHIQTYTQFGSSYKAVIDFFKKARTMFPASDTRNLSRQPANRAGDIESKDLDLTSRTAVGFSQATSRKVAKNLGGPPPPSLSTSQINNDIFNSSLDSPVAISPLAPKKERKATVSKGLFNAMQDTKVDSVINFHENVEVDFYMPKFTRNSSSSSLSSSSGLKRKLIDPIQPSTSKKTSSQPEPTSSAMVKREASKDYLMKIKYALSADEYRSYIRMVKNYNIDSNFKALIESLEPMLKDKNLRIELYEGFTRFVKEEHRTQYKAFLATLNGICK